MGEQVSTRDRNWLKKHDEELAMGDVVTIESAADQLASAAVEEVEESLFSEDAEHVMDADHLHLHEEADEGANH